MDITHNGAGYTEMVVCQTYVYANGTDGNNLARAVYMRDSSGNLSQIRRRAYANSASGTASEFQSCFFAYDGYDIICSGAGLPYYIPSAVSTR